MEQKEHDYSFNFAFFERWMEENRLQAREILNAIGTSDYAQVRKWKNGESEINTRALLRLCNYFCIPLNCFILDNGVPQDLELRHEQAGDKTYPTNGYGTNERGGNRVLPPHTTEHRSTIIPKIKTREQKTEKTENPQLLDRRINEIIERERELQRQEREQFQQERNRLYGIIEKLTSDNMAIIRHANTIHYSENEHVNTVINETTPPPPPRRNRC